MDGSLLPPSGAARTTSRISLRQFLAEAEAAATEAAAHALELPLAGVAVLTALLGFGVAFWLYIRQPGKAEALAKSMSGAYNTLLEQILCR